MPLNKAFMALTAAVVLGSCSGVPSQTALDQNSAQVRYTAAVRDAAFLDEDELLPLVTLTADDPRVVFDDQGRVLLSFFHNHPNLYSAKSQLILQDQLWTVSAGELEAWCESHHEAIADPALRFKSLVGVKPADPYPYITYLWADPKDVLRPATITDVTASRVPARLSTAEDTAYQEWYKGNILYSYFEDAYPWTRAGYTYDYLNDDSEYGITEFILNPGATVEIVSTQRVEDFAREKDLLH